MKRILLLIGLLFCFSAWGWDATGHRLIASIAYWHLKPETRVQVDRLTQLMSHHSNPYRRFLDISVWPDQLYATGDKRFNHWHFIDLPYVQGFGHYDTYYPWDNAVWAIHHCIKKLKSPQVSARMKSHYLSFLVHVVGDVHQPMHCISLFSQQFSQGDSGGNGYSIDSHISDNLHHFWDQGGGLFRLAHKRYPLSMTKVRQLALHLEQQYPKTEFGQRLLDLDPYHWAKDSFHLAKQDAYHIAFGAKVGDAYRAQAQADSAQQVVLAGLRLARVLNQLYGKAYDNERGKDQKVF